MQPRFQDSPKWIAENRMVLARSILERTADLRGYPGPYLAIVADVGMSLRERIAAALAAAEALHAAGWELVAFTDNAQSREMFAIMKRYVPRGV